MSLTPETRDRLKGAFTAWSLAIQSKLTADNPEESYEDLAHQFGKNITTETDLDLVSEFFDWDRLMDIIRKG